MTIERDRAGAHKGVPAICLGNGPSRKGLVSPPDAIVIGCNAAYRDTEGLTYLVSLDRTMMREIIEARLDIPVIGREHTLKKVLTEARIWRDPELHLAARPPSLPFSGYLAMYCACVFGCDPIRLVGYDGGVQNLYVGTNCYRQSNRQPIEKNNNLERGWKYIMDRFPRARFEIPEGCYMRRFKDAVARSAR